MPIYDYVCAACGERTEVIHGIDAPGPRFCPACGAEDSLRKAFVAPAVHFKGSGWAKKDRSTTSRAKAKTDSEGASAGGDGAGEAGSERGKTGDGKGEGGKGEGGEGDDKSSGTASSTSDGRRDSTPSSSRTDAGKGSSSAAGTGKD